MQGMVRLKSHMVKIEDLQALYSNPPWGTNSAKTANLLGQRIHFRVTFGLLLRAEFKREKKIREKSWVYPNTFIPRHWNM
jgi:hypothetical protein